MNKKKENINIRDVDITNIPTPKQDFLQIQHKFCSSNEDKGYLLKQVLGISQSESIGELSDGYHTFNELYHHRAILFAVLCNKFKSKAWKSKLHDDGTMYEGMFIVGINTPMGQATYHYDIDPYWDIFNIKERKKAPKFDGHTSNDVPERLLSLIRREE